MATRPAGELLRRPLGALHTVHVVLALRREGRGADVVEQVLAALDAEALPCRLAGDDGVGPAILVLPVREVPQRRDGPADDAELQEVGAPVEYLLTTELA
jgi:hypothetical protein